MIKIYCDECDIELERNYVGNPYCPKKIGIKGELWRAKITLSKNGHVGEGDLCSDCVKKIIIEGEE